MKKTSKILSGAMALAMLACMSTTAFAETVSEVPGSSIVNVTIEAEAAKEVETVYSVEVGYEPISFKWTAGEANTWNPSAHTLSGATEGKWDKNSADITLKNHSNAIVYYKATIAGDYVPQKDNVTLSLTGGDASQMEADTVSEHNTSADKTLTVNVNGTPDKAISNSIGATVTVSLSSTSLAD